MKPQRVNFFIVVVVTAIVVGGGVYVWQNSSDTPHLSAWKQVAQYNCEQSGGVFENNDCDCPTEFGENVLADAKTGYCQTTFGGPAGEIGEVIRVYELEHVECKNALEQCEGK
jgi:hypothetical protein